MRSIIHRSVFFYITHLLTFSIMPLSTAFAGRKWGVVFHSLLGFVWLPSSVLWSEWGESYSFLRLLPVRDRDVVRAKLGLGLEPLRPIGPCSLWRRWRPGARRRSF